MRKINEIREAFLGINQRNVGFVFPSNNRKDYKLADDKILAKKRMETYGIPCAKTYAIIDKVGGIPAAWNSLQKYETLAIKPSNGSGGEGILILKKSQEGMWFNGEDQITTDAVVLHLASIIMGFFSGGATDRALVEECIVPHDCFHSIYQRGVADIRVILYQEKIALAMLRLPTEQSDGKANLHQGGIGIGIDIESGKMTHGFDGKSYHEVHPDSKAQISGTNIPFWNEILSLSLLTASKFPLKYLGVDIVIDKYKGPLIMEVNVRPGLGIQMVNKKGLKPILNEIDNLQK